MFKLSANQRLPAKILIAGFTFLFMAVYLQAKIPKVREQNAEAQKFPIPFLISNGHREFAWTIIALDGLASAVNAWTGLVDPATTREQRTRLLDKFNDTLDALPGLAKESLGMREVFQFPASILAFELNDIDRSIAVARIGAQDVRLEPDLALTIAYLSHVFGNDLREVAKDYERVQVHFPNVSWLNELIESLKMGKDPFKRSDRNRTAVCRMLTRAFPLATKRLIERDICTKEYFRSNQAQ
ncbi:MAG: hypothetical protein RLZZ488_60 [Pseudomonadota bacterium]|jgi:hypothetical protein